MQASRVTISPKTLELNGLSRKRKSQLRTESVKEFLRSKPAGTTVTISHLMSAAGYNPRTSYGVGWAFIGRLLRDKVIVCDDPLSKKFEKSYSIPGDTHTVKPANWKPSDNPPYGVPKEATEKPQTFETEKPGLVGTVQTLYTVENIVQNAKQFAWERNSDSLRDFIASMQ